MHNSPVESMLLAILMVTALAGSLVAAGPAADVPDAKQILQRVQEIASGLPGAPPNDEERSGLLARTARAQADIGDVAGVRRTVEVFTAGRPRGGFDEGATSRVVEGLMLIAAAQQTSGDREAATATLRQASVTPVDDMTYGNKAIRLVRVATAQVRIGERGAAIATARLAVVEADMLPTSFRRGARESGYTRAYALHRAAIVLSAAGDGGAGEVMKRASQFAEAIENPEHRQQTLAALTKDLAKDGEFAGALRILASSPCLGERPLHELLLASVALEQAKWRDCDGAFRTVDLIPDGPDRAAALLEISRWLSEAGRWREAGATARHAMNAMPFMSSSMNARFLTQVAEASLRADDRAGALASARQVVPLATGPSGGNGFLLASIAPTLAAAGDRGEAEALLGRASALAEAESDPIVKRRRLAEVGGERAKLGDIGGAMRIYTAVADTPDQVSDHLLTDIVSTLVRDGNMPEALRLASMRPDHERARIAASVAAGQARLREDRRAIAWADHQASPSAMARALLAIAREFIDRQSASKP